MLSFSPFYKLETARIPCFFSPSPDIVLAEEVTEIAPSALSVPARRAVAGEYAPAAEEARHRQGYKFGDNTRRILGRGPEKEKALRIGAVVAEEVMAFEPFMAQIRSVRHNMFLTVDGVFDVTYTSSPTCWLFTPNAAKDAYTVSIYLSPAQNIGRTSDLQLEVFWYCDSESHAQLKVTREEKVKDFFVPRPYNTPGFYGLNCVRLRKVLHAKSSRIVCNKDSFKEPEKFTVEPVSELTRVEVSPLILYGWTFQARILCLANKKHVGMKKGDVAWGDTDNLWIFVPNDSRTAYTISTLAGDLWWSAKGITLTGVSLKPAKDQSQFSLFPSKNNGFCVRVLESRKLLMAGLTKPSVGQNGDVFEIFVLKFINEK